MARNIVPRPRLIAVPCNSFCRARACLHVDHEGQRHESRRWLADRKCVDHTGNVGHVQTWCHVPLQPPTGIAFDSCLDGSRLTTVLERTSVCIARWTWRVDGSSRDNLRLITAGRLIGNRGGEDAAPHIVTDTIIQQIKFAQYPSFCRWTLGDINIDGYHLYLDTLRSSSRYSLLWLCGYSLLGSSQPPLEWCILQQLQRLGFSWSSS